jgi:hypothetical protein
MKENSNNLCVLRTVSIYLSKIILIFRTRNIYGYNSLCERIFQLFTGSRRRKRGENSTDQSAILDQCSS